MDQKINNFKVMIKKIIDWLVYWLWIRPISRPKPPKATEVTDQYVCIDYKGQWVNMKKTELPAWNKMGRKDKRGMARRFTIMEKKGQVKFTEINGKVICIKNKDYEANNGKHGDGEAGSGKR